MSDAPPERADDAAPEAKRKGCLFWGVSVTLTLLVLLLVSSGLNELQQRFQADYLAQRFVDEKCDGGFVVDVTSGEVPFDTGCNIEQRPGYVVTVEGCKVYSTVEVSCPLFGCEVVTGRSITRTGCGGTVF